MDSTKAERGTETAGRRGALDSIAPTVVAAEPDGVAPVMGANRPRERSPIGYERDEGAI